MTELIIGTQRKLTGLLAIIMVMVALALVACTDSEDSTATSAPATATSAPATTISESSPTTTTAPPATATLPPTDTPTDTEVPAPTTPAPTTPAAATTVAPTSVPQVTSSDSPPKIVITSNGEFGDILTDSSGMTLYIFDRDTEGVSNCPGGCLGNWPPLLTEYGAVAIGDITGTIATIDRGDGIKQVTINGFPAYYWKGDVTEGETSGNGVENNWWVFNTDGTPQRPAKIALAEHSSLGSILTDGAGISLYLFDNDTAGMSSCSGGCLNSWPALLTEYGTAATNDVTGTLGTITRGDGSLQVTVNDMPVYYWVNDAVAGDAGGHSLGSVWWLLNAEGNAIRQMAEAAATPTPTPVPVGTAVTVVDDGY